MGYFRLCGIPPQATMDVMEIPAGCRRQIGLVYSLNEDYASETHCNLALFSIFVLVGAGEYARYDKETGIYIIPITSLGA